MATITIDECNSVVSEFRTQHRLIFQSSNVHGLVVTLRDNVPVLRLLVHKKLPLERLSAQERMPTTFDYHYAGQHKSIETEVVEAPLANAQAGAPEPNTRSVKARAGEIAWGVDLVGAGTGGWNLLLNNVPVCIGNWHVFCGLGNATPIGRRVKIARSDLASLYSFQPVYPGAVNQWDYALAKYDTINDVAGQYRPCNDGTVMRYPMRLSPAPFFGQEHYKVGNRDPICRTGSLVSVGFRNVEIEEGVSASFEKQLIFTKMSDPGDSGSIIVRSSDNTVTGLLFAGSESETIANPLYTNPWIPAGRFITDDGEEIPAFIGDPHLTGISTTSEHSIDTRIVGQRVVDGRVETFDDLPSLSAGKLFLRTIRGEYHASSRRVVHLQPIPAPIRDVPVEIVVGGFDPAGPTLNSSMGIVQIPERIPVVLLCFG